MKRFVGLAGEIILVLALACVIANCGWLLGIFSRPDQSVIDARWAFSAFGFLFGTMMATAET